MRSLGNSLDFGRPTPNHRKILTRSMSPKVSRKIPAPQRVDSTENLEIPLNADRFRVLALRQALRDKFCGTEDLKKLYSQWDAQGMGVVRPEDLMVVVRSIGLECEVGDVQALVAAYSPNKLGALTYPDMAKLLEKKEESFDLDSYLKQHMIEFSSKLALNKNYRLKKIQNVLKYYLNIHREQLSKEFQARDRRGTGRVPFNQFVQVMNVMGIPYYSINGLNLKILYFDFGADLYGLDYTKFLEHIASCKPFQLDSEEDVTLDSTVEKKLLTSHLFEDIQEGAAKVRRLLRMATKVRDVLFKELLERYGVKVSKRELRHYVATKGRLDKTDIEKFLEMFSYDKDECATTSSIVDWVFEKTKVDVGLKQRILPRLERSKLTADQRFRQLLEEVRKKIVNQGSFTNFDRKRSGYVSRRDAKDLLEMNNIPFDENDIRKFFEGTVGDPVPIAALEVQFFEKLRKSKYSGKRYEQRLKMERCDSTLHKRMPIKRVND